MKNDFDFRKKNFNYIIMAGTEYSLTSKFSAVVYRKLLIIIAQ